MHGSEPVLYYGLFALIVHDVLNKSTKPGSPSGPLEVTNDYGRTWKLAGDGTLALSRESQRVAQEAVEESFQLHHRSGQAATAADDPAEAPGGGARADRRHRQDRAAPLTRPVAPPLTPAPDREPPPRPATAAG
jgi:hypothetical protein